MMRNAWIAILVVSVVGVSASCARSPQYKRDQEYPSPDSQLSYYSGKSGGKTSSQRIEAMGQPKKRVFVLDFWNDTPVRMPSQGPAGEVGSFAADELKRGLFLTQRMIVPTDIKTDLGTADFLDKQGGERVKVSQLIREGRKMGVAVLVIGRVSKIAFRQRGDDIGVLRQKQSLAGVDLELKLFDVQGGREIMAVARSGEASSNTNVVFDSQNIESQEFRAELVRLATRQAVAGLVPDVVKAIEKMTWEGRVAKIQGARIYINAGRASGLVAGDILKVISAGDDVYDPTTGAFLGRTQGQLKGTLEVTDFIGTDGAVAEVHTGANFADGDTVQLY